MHALILTLQAGGSIENKSIAEISKIERIIHCDIIIIYPMIRTMPICDIASASTRYFHLQSKKKKEGDQEIQKKTLVNQLI